MADIPRTHWSQIAIPRRVKPLGSNDLISFNWHQSIDPTKFKVIHDDLSGNYFSLGSLKETIKLPDINFPQPCKLIVVGINNQGEQVRFLGQLNRGHVYFLPHSKRGDHNMMSAIPQNCLNSMIYQ
jgi:hypothetical protein